MIFHHVKSKSRGRFVPLSICFFIRLHLIRFFVTSTTRVLLFSFPIRENTLTQHNIPAYELGTLFLDFIWEEFLEASLFLEIIQFHNIILLILLNYSNFKNQLYLQTRYSIFLLLFFFSLYFVSYFLCKLPP